ncbi:MAG TPA: alpha/beta hydrolase [Actinomycetota bacterium]|nr:alpha/beta hydrolase [Actinomycetota bacterium]
MERRGEILGYDEAGEGPALVLVHGFPFDRRLWAGQLRGLSNIRRVVAPDLRGRGLSAAIAAEGATIDTHADDVAATIASLGVEQADVAGLSMGGYVAFALWRRHPELVRSLILADTRAGPDSPDGKRSREATADLVRAGEVEALADAMLVRLLSPGTGGEVRRRIRTMFRETPATTSVADLIAMRDRPDSWPDMGTIGVPALVLRGDEDTLTSPEEAESQARAILQARCVTIPGAGHVSPLENPAAFNAAVREFLEPAS